MYFVVAFISIAAIAGIVLLARAIADGDRRVVIWCIALVLATVLTSFMAQMVSIYYKLPWGWVVVVGAGFVVVVSLVWLVGNSVGWRARKVAAIAGMMVLSLLLLTFILIAAPTGTLFTPLFEVRAQQIAEARGFDVLLPSEAKMNTDYGNPVSPTEEGDGVAIGYDRFNLVERTWDGELGREELEAFVAAGEHPVGDIGPGSGVPEDAEYTELEVGGRPAIGVSYKAVTEEKLDDAFGTDDINILVFERDGIVVTLYSQGYMEYQRDGSYTPRPPLSFAELTEIGGSLQPLD